MRAARSTATAVPSQFDGAPVSRACLVPDFEPREVLGRKGTRSMDRATALAITAVGALLEQLPGAHAAASEEMALVLGTSTGSVASIMSFTRDSLTGNKPFFVEPGRFPNTVMNCAAGHSAIWHRLRGPNVTLAAGRSTGLMALNYARRLQCRGRARAVVCGAVEEFSSERAWLDWHLASPSHGERLLGEGGERLLGEDDDRLLGKDDERLLGEGCAVVMLEPPHPGANPPLAELMAVQTGMFADAEHAGELLVRCLERAMGTTGISSHDVWAVAPCDAPEPLGEQERAALAEVFLGDVPLSLSAGRLLGDTSAASVAFQLAALLAAAGDAPDANGRYALLTSTDADGVVGCALVRLAGGDPA